MSLDIVTKNEIDFTIADKRHTFRDVSVVIGLTPEATTGYYYVCLCRERARLVKTIVKS